MEIVELKTDEIRPSEGKQTNRMKDIDGLVQSIEAVGLLYPIQVVTRMGPDEEIVKYRIIDGDRRWAAFRRMEVEEIPAIVRAGVVRADQEVKKLVANVQRKQMTPMEEAEIIGVLLDLKRNVEDIASDLGMSSRTVARRAMLLTLISAWKKKVGQWPYAQLEIIARYDKARQKELLERYAYYVPGLDRLKADLARGENFLRHAPWRVADDSLDPKAGACASCDKRSSCQAFLFHEANEVISKNDRCLDPVCWSRKLDAYIVARLAMLRKKHKNLYQVQTTGLTTGHENIPGVLKSYEYVKVKKQDRGAKPALVCMGPGAGSLIWIKLAGRVGERKAATRKKMANLSAADQAKARAGRLFGRRAKIVVNFIAEMLLNEKEPVLFRIASLEREVIMLNLDLQFGIARQFHSVKSWGEFMKLSTRTLDEVFKAWWPEIQDSLYSSVKVIRKGEEAAQALYSLQYLAVTILGLDWDTLLEYAVKEIPNKKLGEGEVDSFDPR